MTYKKILLLISSILFLSLASAGNLSIIVNPGVAGVNYEYMLNFSQDNTCSEIVFNYYQIVTTNSQGFNYISIPINSSLENITKIKYICEYRDWVLRKIHPTGDLFFSNLYAQNITTSSLQVNGNINSSGNIQSNSINVTKNVTANWFIGLFSWLIKPDVSSSYLNFNGSTLGLNESFLNSTIDQRALTFNGTSMILSVNTTYNIQQLLNSTGIYDFNYNQTTATFNLYGSNWYNHTLSSYNQWGNFWFNQTANLVLGINNLTASMISNLSITQMNWTYSLIANTSFNQKANTTVQQYVDMINNTRTAQQLLNGTNANFSSIIVSGNVTSDWFNGKWNGTSFDDWLSSNGNTWTFNSSKLQTTYLNASLVSTIAGTPQGNGGWTNYTYDDISYNVSEVATNPSLDIRFNYTGITNFNQILIRYHSDVGENHIMYIQLYDYSTTTWENYLTSGEVIDYKLTTMGVIDPSEHIENGVVQLRFYQPVNGIITHKHYFDMVVIASGLTSLAGQEVDPLSWHKNTNIEMNGYNITNVSYAQGNTLNFTTLWLNNINISTWIQNISKNWTLDTFNNWNSSWDNNWLTQMLSANDTALNTSIKQALTFNTTYNIGVLYNYTASMISNFSFNQNVLTYNDTIQNNNAWNQSGTNVILNKIGSNVGIGETAPSYPLSVKTSTGVGTMIQAGASTGGSNILLGGWATMGEIRGGNGAYFGQNVVASTTVSNQLNILNNATSGGADAVRIRTTEGITFHTLAGTVVAGDAFSSERMRINEAGNVGIGATNPTSLLYVNSSTNSAWATQILNNGTTNAHGLYVYLGASSTGVPFRIDKGTTTYLLMDTSGKVGIGTTSPTHTLNVVGNSNFTGNVSIRSNLGISGIASNTIEGSAPYVRFSSVSSNNYTDIQQGAGGLDFWTYTNTWNNRMRISETGNVGIGTTSPVSNGGAGSRILQLNTDTAGVWSILHITNAETGALAADGTILGHLGDKNFQIYNYENGNITFTTNSQVMKLTSTGNVGIGTTTPGGKLDIKTETDTNGLLIRETTDTSLTHNFYIDASDNGQAIMYANGQTAKIGLNTAGNSYFNGGNVGIGVAAPGYLLSVEGATNPTIQVADTTSGTGVSNGVILQAADAKAYLWNFENDWLQLGTNNAAAMTILSGGNVGIGTTSPSSLLQLGTAANIYAGTGAGTAANWMDISYNSYYSGGYKKTMGGYSELMEMSNGTIAFYHSGQGTAGSTPSWQTMLIMDGMVNNSYFPTGNVGIGTTSPAYNLEIANSAKGLNVSGMLYVNSSNVGIGTINPTHKLEVSSLSAVPFNVYLGDKTAVQTYTNVAGLQLSSYQSEGGAPYTKLADIVANADVTAAAAMRFLVTPTGGTPTEAIRIDKDGNVGIGTTSPVYKLEIGNSEKALNVSGMLYVNSTNLLIGTTILRGWALTVSSSKGGSATYSNGDIGIQGNGTTSGVYGTSYAGNGVEGSSEFGYDFYTSNGAGKSLFGGDVFLGTAGQKNDINITGELWINGINNTAPDYVFEKDYKVKTLDEVKSFTKTNQHLPNIKSAEEVATSGINVVEDRNSLLESIENIWLHLFGIDDRIKTLETENTLLKSCIKNSGDFEAMKKCF
ncbi:MAG: hypothetical protein WC758_07910 [Candidatus Woesearchaeota archaeon]|jgi:hypothetical protein